ncbi:MULTISPECIES: hypothetical protein [unclassified Paraburkholderia]|uniref:hypothetical protein n=1 Tax=unclassified Paraburkholderia TaxID=2615204 RepID=UPI002AAF6055|nr:MULTISPECIES: hypothetical protein [unclassified Paraburkholderia]
MSFSLQAAVYRPAGPWPEIARRGARTVGRELARAIGEQIERATKGIPREQIGVNMVVSTILDMPFTSGWIEWDDIASQMPSWTSAVPHNLVTAYECSSWGFVLRYANLFERHQPYIVLSIVDINLFDLTHWHENPNWGKSGFGIATVVLKFSGDDTIQCDVARSANGFGEFCVGLRNYMERDKAVRVTPPFFPPNISALYDRLLPRERLLPNLVDQYGHSFGSDPWIALIEHRLAKRDRPGERYLATSVSLNGYWCFAELEFATEGIFHIDPMIEPCRIERDRQMESLC